MLLLLSMATFSSLAAPDFISDYEAETIIEKFYKVSSNKNLQRFAKLTQRKSRNWSVIADRLQASTLGQDPLNHRLALILLEKGLESQGYPNEFWNNTLEWNGNTVYFNNNNFDINMLNLAIKDVNNLGMSKGFSPVGHDGKQIHVCRLLRGSKEFWVEVPSNQLNNYWKTLMIRDDDYGLCWNPLVATEYWKERISSIKPY